MSAQWLRKDSILNFTATSVACKFKDAPQYEGDLDGLKAHIKAHNAHFSGSEVEGAKVGMFYTFRPSNQRQRDWLAGCISSPVEASRTYTFSTRWAAVQAYKALEASGIDSNASNWPLGFIVSTEAPSPV